MAKDNSTPEVSGAHRSSVCAREKLLTKRKGRAFVQHHYIRLHAKLFGSGEEKICTRGGARFKREKPGFGRNRDSQNLNPPMLQAPTCIVNNGRHLSPSNEALA